MIDKKRIEEEAQQFFEWPDQKRRDTVTLTSCVIFAATIAEMVRAELHAAMEAGVAAERERCAKIVDAPPGTEAWEVIGGEEGLAMLRELAAQIRGA